MNNIVELIYIGGEKGIKDVKWIINCFFLDNKIWKRLVLNNIKRFVFILIDIDVN